MAWPGVLKEVARAAGSDAAFQMAVQFGGSEFHVPKPAHLRRSQEHPLVVALGPETAVTVSKLLESGGSVYVHTARDLCVLHLKAQGMSGVAIARRLGVSTRTVRRIMRRRAHLKAQLQP